MHTPGALPPAALWLVLQQLRRRVVRVLAGAHRQPEAQLGWRRCHIRLAALLRSKLGPLLRCPGHISCSE